MLKVLAAGAVALIAVAALLVPLLAATPASAQGFFGWGEQRRRPPPPPQPSFNPFGLFQPSPNPYYPDSDRPPARRKDVGERAPVESTRAPPARKPEGTPTTNIIVLGDSMADWLAYGLEDAYSDNAEIGIVRKNRANAGLIRHETRSEPLDLVQSTKEYLAAEKPTFIVIMIGAADRQAIRERPAKPAPQPNAQPGQPPSIVAEPPAAAASYEFRSERWTEIYGKRIDDMIAVLKAKGVPVLWVGLPVIRGARGKADVQFLNDLYKGRAEKAGITYVDVWDGFADENGDYAQYGPDYDGQTRRLRSHDGVHFTKAGALKLGHLVERDLDRLIQARTTPVALPAPEQPAVTPSGPAPRPDVGPVVSLTATTPEPEGLAGSGQPRTTTDPVASRVLVKGDTVSPTPGRADDFAWPRSETAADANDVIPIVAPAPTAVRPTPAAKNAPAERAVKRPGQAAATPPAKRQVQ